MAKNNSSVASHIEAAQVGVLFSRARFVYSINVIVSAIVGVFLWNSISSNVLVAWVLAVIVITSIRFRLLLKYDRDKFKIDHLDYWKSVATWGAALSGITWGLSWFFLFPQNALPQQIFLLVTLLGMLAGSAVSWHAYFPSFQAYFLPTALLTSIRFILLTLPGNEDRVMFAAMGALFLAFTAGLYALARNSNQLLTQLFVSQHEKMAIDERYRMLFQGARIPMLLIDPADGRIVDVNDAAESYYGYPHGQLVEMNIDQINMLPRQEIAEKMSSISKEKISTFNFRHKLANGEIRDVEAHSGLVNLKDRHLLYSIIYDITERKQAEESLLITASVFNSSQEAIMITDVNNIIVDVNPAFTRITGYSREEAIGKNPSLLSSNRQGEMFFAKMWRSLNQEKHWRGEIWNKRKSGEIFAGLLSISSICNNDGKVLRYVAVFSDISHIKEHEAELRRVAHYDALTGIPNRALLADRMKQAIAQTSREKNMMAVCYLDLDGFKPINDTMGHDAGDQVLVEVADRIGNTIRGGDTVARLGGDEFVVLLLGLEQGEECMTTLERLLAEIAQPIVVKNKSSTVSASIGVSIYPLDDEDSDTLLRHADQAMYLAKQSGKNRFHIYDPALDQRARNQNEFLKSIRHALERDQFELYYQPKVNLRTKELVGAEALIRWRHPERGLLSPAEFLRHIENTDLDIEIGEWVTATALAQINRWQNAGLDIEVSINISGYHLESPHFLERLQQQLARYPDMPMGKLQIEVLETVALNDIAIVRGIIETCSKIGVGFALDDFGTGYSSLSYLSGLPVDALKIDQSFVHDMLDDKGDMAIVQGIIALARAFDRQTVAEGIETKEHYQMLLDMGCELGQGYAIARPMPTDELTNWHAR